jgi:hypothetical protein
MTHDDIARAYSIDRSAAEMVEEYLKESNNTDPDWIPFIVSTILQSRKRYRCLYFHDLDIAVAKDSFYLFPEDMRNEYGDKYVLGLIEILKLDD